MVKNNISKHKSGFTMAEMIIVIAIIGLIAMILITVLRDMMPYEEAIIFKKAYYNTKRIVEELYNDEDFYPKYYSNNADPLSENNNHLNNFRNLSPVTVDDITYQGQSKFVDLFASKMDISNEGVRCLAAIGGEITCRFTTYRDNMVWTMTGIDFRKDGRARLTIDTNGVRKGPNCIYLKDICKRPDTFNIIIEQDGFILPETEIERRIIESDVPQKK